MIKIILIKKFLIYPLHHLLHLHLLLLFLRIFSAQFFIIYSYIFSILIFFTSFVLFFFFVLFSVSTVKPFLYFFNLFIYLFITDFLIHFTFSPSSLNYLTHLPFLAFPCLALPSLLYISPSPHSLPCRSHSLYFILLYFILFYFILFYITTICCT